jgi:hypothetical protein
MAGVTVDARHRRYEAPELQHPNALSPLHHFIPMQFGCKPVVFVLGPPLPSRNASIPSLRLTLLVVRAPSSGYSCMLRQGLFLSLSVACLPIL